MKKTLKGLTFALSLVLLVGCFGPKRNPLKAKEKLEGEGYTCVLVQDDSALQPIADGLVAMLSASRGNAKTLLGNYDDFETMVAYYFDSSENAKKFYESYKETFADQKDDYKEKGVKYRYAKFGCVVYAGTPEAIKNS